MPQTHIREHIDVIAKHEQDFLEKRTRTERIGDRIAGFAGSFSFIFLHLFVFTAWIALNTLPIRTFPRFDPKPFSLLATLVALEALLLASFILMRQARMSRRAEERDHLMLQILLLTEKEITAVLSMDRQIATQVGLEKMANSTEVEELSEHTSIDDVAQNIKDALPPAD